MAITIGKYSAEGPFGNTRDLRPNSGVYIILGRSNALGQWNVVDVGEAGDVQARVGNHDRTDQWKRSGHAQLAVAVIYCDARMRMTIEAELRRQFNPPCGVR